MGDEGTGLLDAGVLECDGRVLRIAEPHQLITNEVLARLRESLVHGPAASAVSALTTAGCV
jgi:hypothetical protein